MNAATEEEIVKRLKALDFPGAYTAAVRAYGSALRTHISTIIRDQDRANDAYSAFLLNLWAGLEGFRGDSTFFYWAKRVATNTANREHRDSWNRRGERLDDADRLQASPPRWTTAKYRRTSEKLRSRMARANLRVEEELVVGLHVDWHFDFNTIEELTGIAAGTARMRYKRAKDKLKKVLLTSDDSNEGC